MVFVSHRHHDHYNPVIFELVKEYPNTRYVISKDVPVKREIKQYKEQGIDLEKYITVAEKNGMQTIVMPSGNRIRVETLKSTDEGVAFLLEYKEKTIYHAGDLNLWLWEGESKQYNEKMRRNY